MKLLFIVLIISLCYSEAKQLWCYNSTSNMDLFNLFNERPSLIRASNDNPCINATVVVDGKVGYINSNLRLYQEFIKYTYGIDINSDPTVDCPARLNLKPSSKSVNTYTDYCTCKKNACNMGAIETVTQNCFSERIGLGFLNLKDRYGHVEKCDDPNDFCVTGTGNAPYPTVVYKGCFGSVASHIIARYADLVIPRNVGLYDLYANNTQVCQEKSLLTRDGDVLLTLCRCTGQFCNVNLDKAFSQTCTAKRVGFGKHMMSDYEKPPRRCHINEPCRKMVSYIDGRAISVEECASRFVATRRNNTALSFPENKCVESNQKIRYFNTDAIDTATICSCNNSKDCNIDDPSHTKCVSKSIGLHFLGISDYYSPGKETCMDTDVCYKVQYKDETYQISDFKSKNISDPSFEFWGCSRTYKTFIKPHLTVKFKSIDNENNTCFRTTMSSEQLDKELPVTVCSGYHLIDSVGTPKLECNKRNNFREYGYPSDGKKTVICNGLCVSVILAPVRRFYNKELFQGCIDNVQIFLKSNEAISFTTQGCFSKRFNDRDFNICACKDHLCNNPQDYFSSTSSLVSFNYILTFIFSYVLLRL